MDVDCYDGLFHRLLRLSSTMRIVTILFSVPVISRRCSDLPMGFLMTRCAKCDQIFGSIIAESAPRSNVMDLKVLHGPAGLAPPAIPFQDFAAELAISFRVKPQPWPLGTDPSQIVTCTSSRSCSRCGFGRPMTSRVRQGNKVSRLLASKLTPARKSAQIISKQ